MIALKLRGLEGVVTSSAVDPVRDGRGWAFREGRGHGPDPVNGFALLRDAYLATDPAFAGHISVPALWDRATHQLVSNHYATMTVDLETQFADWADPSVDLLPAAHRDEIHAINTEIVTTLATAAYAAMAVGTQAQYDAVSDRVYAAFGRFDARLAERRFLVGDGITDADLLLYVQLVRFDLVAVPLGRLTRRRLVDHPNLWAYARDLYQRPAFRETTDFDHIARGTFGTGAGIRTHRIVPATPDADWDAPHGRDALGYEEPGEAELVAVGVAEVEVALAPRRVRRRHLGRVAVRPDPGVHGVDVGHPEDDAAPDRGDGRVLEVELQVEEAVAGAVGRERSVGTADKVSNPSAA